MALQSSGTIKMSEIAEEKKGSGLPSGGYWQNISLRGLSVDSVTDFSYYNGDSIITADYPGTPNSTQPHGMAEFYNYSHLLQWESNDDLTHSSVSYAAAFDDTVSGTTLAFGQIEYNINIFTIELNNNYWVYFGIEEEDQFNGAGLFWDSGNNGSATSMTTGTTYSMQRIEFTQANFPDSYTITASNTINSNQIGMSVTEAAGQGGNYAASADWSGNTFNNGTPTTFTLQEPGVNNNTAGAASPLTTHGVVINGSVNSSSSTTRVGTCSCTYTLTFKKSGYPDRQAATHTVENEMTIALSGGSGGGGPR